MIPLVASLRLSELFWEAECFGDPLRRETPFIVGSATAMGVVMAASPAARHHGVQVGMPISLAREVCPQASVLPGRLDRLLELVSAIQTLVCERMPEAIRIDVAHAVTPPRDWPGQELHAILDALRHEIRERLGVSVACGVATTRLAADVAARLVAPAGLLHVLPGYQSRMLASVSLRWLDGVDDAAIEQWSRLGCQTIGDLAGLSRELALQQGGGAGDILRRLACGDDRRSTPDSRPLGRLTTLVSTEDRDLPSHQHAVTRAIVDAVTALAAHPHRKNRPIVAIHLRAVDMVSDGPGLFRVLRGHRQARWDSASDIEAAIADTAMTFTDLPSRMFVSIALEPPPSSRVGARQSQLERWQPARSRQGRAPAARTSEWRVRPRPDRRRSA